MIIFLFLSASLAFANETIYLPNNQNLAALAQEKIIKAKPGTTIIFPEGKFQFSDELIVNTSHITLKGQGHDKTILSFKGQQVGAQGILATKDSFRIEDMGIEDTKGDGIKVERANGVVFNRVRVEWTRGPNTENGAYGFYPVQTQNVLIENCIVRGASDAGVYVGQSRNIIVRNNIVEWNVAGIEIENSRFADVYKNHTRHNTAGVLVFDLPNLEVKGGKQTRIFDNLIEGNNTKNFAPVGSVVSSVPSGTAIMIMANDDVEIFNNKIRDNQFTGVLLVNYKATRNLIQDSSYDSRIEKVYVHDNSIQRYEGLNLFPKIFETDLHFLAYYLNTLRVPEIIFDGIDDGTYHGKKFTIQDRICSSGNKDGKGNPINLVNFHLDSGNTSLFGKIPGGPVEKNPPFFMCSHNNLPKVVLEKSLPLPKPRRELSEKEIRSHCALRANKKMPNYGAYKADCPKLSDYNLFEDPTNPTAGPLGKIKLPYTLSSSLFTDYALKDRFIFLPPGGSINYNDKEVFRFPVGTIITKTFKYKRDYSSKKPGERIIETRLLIKRDYGWEALPYVWDERQKEAYLTPSGAEFPMEVENQKGKRIKITYQVPNRQKCFSCHEVAGEISPIGLQAKFLNHKHHYPAAGIKNQLQYMFDHEVLKSMRFIEKAPKAPDYNNTTANINDRARAYLHINCAHCHQPNGRARTSGLFLEYERKMESVTYGNCKPPVAAGRGSGKSKYIIEPGKKADLSILHVRMNSSDPGVMMPEVGRSIIHEEGVDIISKWIEQLPVKNCSI